MKIIVDCYSGRRNPEFELNHQEFKEFWNTKPIISTPKSKLGMRGVSVCINQEEVYFDATENIALANFLNKLVKG